MNRMKIAVIVIFVFCGFQTNAQSFTFATDTVWRQIGPLTLPAILYGIFDINTCDYDVYIQSTINENRDLTILPNGDLYGYDFIPSYPSDGVTYIDLTRRFFGLRGRFQDSLITALGCVEESGLVYAAGKGISTFDPNGRVFKYLGDLPPDMQAGGDFTYRNGKLYLSTIHNALIEVNLQNPMNSTWVMDFPANIPLIDAFATYHYACDSTITYAIAADSTGSTIYEFDIDNQRLTEVCRTDIPIRGAASAFECVLPACQVYVDLDGDNSSGGIRYNYNPKPTCTAPIPITDNDLEIYAEERIDSIIVSLTGVIDIREEYLIIGNIPNISISGSGTVKIKLINTGAATIEDFKQALKSIFYQNDRPVPTLGNREIWVRAYTRSFVSEIATAKIKLENTLELEQTITPPSCYGEVDGSFSITAKEGTAPYHYLWEDGDTTSMRINLNAGDYAVTVTDKGGCELIDTIQITQPDSLFVTITASADSICGPSGFLTASLAGGTAPYTFLWSQNEQTSEAIDNLEAGRYSVTVTDGNGCKAEGIYELFAANTIITREQLTFCEGEIFTWNNITISQDTSLCLGFNTSSGCDSLHCIDIQFLDSILVQENRTICQGEMYDFNGILLNRDTTICQTFPASNGCDSTQCLTLRVLDRSSSISASICEGQTFLFGNLTLSVAGVYTDTIRNGGLCDSLVVLNLQVEPLPGLSITTEGSLCEGGTAKLSAGNGFARYQWSNGATASFINVSNPGSYSVTVTNADGCTASDTIEIRDTNLNATLTTNNPTCFGKKDGRIVIDTVIGGTAPFFYAINERTLQPSNTFGQLSSGTYQLRVEDVSGCFYETTITLQEPEPLTLNLGEDLTLTLGDSITLQAITNALNPLVQWNPPTGLNCDTCLIVIARPAESTRYEVTVTDPNGCVAKDDLSILINRRDGIFAPSAFSPNGDGVNDRFMIFTNSSVAKIHYFRVFDRWGNLLYEVRDFLPNDNTIGWDGNFQGKEMPAGSYVFTISFEKIDQQTETFQGEALLLR